MSNELHDWFLSLPEGRQKVLSEDKWMLANAAFEAGMTIEKKNNNKLHRVVSTSSDLVKARHNEQFREFIGGITSAEIHHENAVKELEAYYDEEDQDN